MLVGWPKIQKHHNQVVLQEKGKAPGSFSDRNCLDEVLGDLGKWSFLTVQIRAKIFVRCSHHARGKNYPSLSELAVSTWTGHTDPRHQCHQT